MLQNPQSLWSKWTVKRNVTTYLSRARSEACERRANKDSPAWHLSLLLLAWSACVHVEPCIVAAHRFPIRTEQTRQFLRRPLSDGSLEKDAARDSPVGPESRQQPQQTRAKLWLGKEGKKKKKRPTNSREKRQPAASTDNVDCFPLRRDEGGRRERLTPRRRRRRRRYVAARHPEAPLATTRLLLLNAGWCWWWCRCYCSTRLVYTTRRTWTRAPALRERNTPRFRQ